MYHSSAALNNNNINPEPEELSRTPHQHPYSQNQTQQQQTPSSKQHHHHQNHQTTPSQNTSRSTSTANHQHSVLTPNNNLKTPQNQPNHQISSPSTSAEKNNHQEGGPLIDEYRISPVSVSVTGPLSLRFPGSEFAEVSVPSLSADVLVIASLADSHANGECSLGIHRSHVRNAELERETGVIQFEVQGVRSFGDSTIRLRAQDSALDLATKLLWLVTGQSSHASPAPELVTRAANALHAIAALKHESKKQERVSAANFLNERRMSRRKMLQDKWDREETLEKETLVTRNTILAASSPASKGAFYHNNHIQSPGFQRSISEIMKDSSPVVDMAKLRNKNAINAEEEDDDQQADARALYADQLRSMLMKGLGNSPLH